MSLITSVLAESALTLSPLILAVLLRVAVDAGRTLSRRRSRHQPTPTTAESRRAA